MWIYDLTIYGSPEFDGYATFGIIRHSLTEIESEISDYPNAEFDLTRRWQTNESVRDSCR